MYDRRLILVPTRASLALAHSARSDTLPEPYSFRASYVPSPPESSDHVFFLRRVTGATKHRYKKNEIVNVDTRRNRTRTS